MIGDWLQIVLVLGANYSESNQSTFDGYWAPRGHLSVDSTSTSTTGGSEKMPSACPMCSNDLEESGRYTHTIHYWARLRCLALLTNGRFCWGIVPSGSMVGIFASI